MINARKEFEFALQKYKKQTGKQFHVVCAQVTFDDYNRKPCLATLEVDYSAEDFFIFLDTLDFEYDSGFGEQKLFGTVWGMEGKWMERGEYDGREWWKFNKYPEIPEILYKKEQL